MDRLRATERAEQAEWVQVLSVENLPGRRNPTRELLGWLRERGIDWMPFEQDDLCFGLACGPDADTGRWRGWFSVRVRAAALWQLGLHPDQPTSAVRDPVPPAWWHAAGERYAAQRTRSTRSRPPTPGGR
ncbi:hypothetical protein ACFY1L_45900 [Streptomyces sp. NPDC001663]|uniref:hypothetical protein n=1 Tax=Streptomyces sp. NPDC001663 TaxID=3364597 RepID=UPI0036AE5E6D